MSIKISSSLRAAPVTESTGFQLIFTEGITYNLDELVALRDRNDSNTALTVQVIYMSDVVAKVMDKLKDDIRIETDAAINNIDVANKIAEIIADTYRKYATTYKALASEIAILNLDESGNSVYDIPEDYQYLNSEINKYLKTVYSKYDLNFTIGFKDVSQENWYTITYNFSSSDMLDEKFNEYFDLYAEEYEKEIATVEEGGLAVSDLASTITSDSIDYKSYLLSASPSETLTGIETTTEIRPHIIWTDGDNEDTSTEEDNRDVYDDISNIEATLAALSTKINQVVPNTSSEINISTVDGSLLTDTSMVPNVGAVFNYVETRTDSNIIEKPTEIPEYTV